MNALCAKDTDTVAQMLLAKHNGLVLFFENTSLNIWVNMVTKFVYQPD